MKYRRTLKRNIAKKDAENSASFIHLLNMEYEDDQDYNREGIIYASHMKKRAIRHKYDDIDLNVFINGLNDLRDRGRGCNEERYMMVVGTFVFIMIKSGMHAVIMKEKFPRKYQEAFLHLRSLMTPNNIKTNPDRMRRLFAFLASKNPAQGFLNSMKRVYKTGKDLVVMDTAPLRKTFRYDFVQKNWQGLFGSPIPGHLDPQIAANLSVVREWLDLK